MFLTRGGGGRGKKITTDMFLKLNDENSGWSLKQHSYEEKREDIISTSISLSFALI